MIPRWRKEKRRKKITCTEQRFYLWASLFKEFIIPFSAISVIIPSEITCTFSFIQLPHLFSTVEDYPSGMKNIQRWRYLNFPLRFVTQRARLKRSNDDEWNRNRCLILDGTNSHQYVYRFAYISLHIFKIVNSNRDFFVLFIMVDSNSYSASTYYVVFKSVCMTDNDVKLEKKLDMVVFCYPWKEYSYEF